MDQRVRILLWDVHGGYTDALLGGAHEYLFCRDDDPEQLGEFGQLVSKGLRRHGADRPATAHEVTVEQVRDEPPDVVLAQRLEEVAALGALIRPGGRPGPAVFLEHNTPKGAVPDTRHPLADEDGWHLVHVTHFNRLFWDSGSTPVCVIEHGLPDPGHRYTGDVARGAFVVNEPVRRWRTTGTDLLGDFEGVSIDAFGIDGDRLPDALGAANGHVSFAGNLSSTQLEDELSRRRFYLHLTRWTSLGLSLINAMMLGLPVVALGTTEAFRAVPSGAGVCSTDLSELVAGARGFVSDPEAARRCGAVARAHALDRFDHGRFLQEWTCCLEEVAG
jgi:hypothetical protein